MPLFSGLAWAELLPDLQDDIEIAAITAKAAVKVAEEKDFRNFMALGLFHLEGVLQGDGAIEYRMVWRGVRILEEVAGALELHGNAGVVFQ